MTRLALLASNSLCTPASHPSPMPCPQPAHLVDEGRQLLLPLYYGEKVTHVHPSTHIADFLLLPEQQQELVLMRTALMVYNCHNNDASM